MKNRKLNRLQGYDYASNQLYFVTSCVHNRVCCFGNVVNGQMVLNPYGQIAHQQFVWLEQQYPYVVLHAFVVMPNHVHAVIEIDSNIMAAAVGTGRDLSLRSESSESSVPIKIKSLSELMGAYKTTVSKQIHLLGDCGFAWQRSFHDHIINDEQSYHNICQYIHNNPLNWVADKLNDNNNPTTYQLES